jgi:hypothetical protein
MSEQRKAIIIATGMDNTALGKSIRTMVQDVKLAGEEIKRGFMPASMTGGLVAYYRNAGKTAARSFKEGEAEAGGMGGMGGMLKGAAGFLGISFGLEAISSLEEKANVIANISALTGLTMEHVQRLNIAFKQMGIPIEVGDSAIAKLNTTVGEAREGGEKAQKAFEKWGIAIEGKNNAEIIAEISDKMHSMADPALRSAMAVDLMGKTGKELVPLLMQGAAAMKQMGEHGPIMSKEDIEAVRTLHESIATFVNYIEVGLGRVFGWVAKISQFIGELSVGPETYGKAEAEATLHPKSDNPEASAIDAENAAAQTQANETREDELQKKVDSLRKERATKNVDVARVDQASVTLEQLAGRGYNETLKKYFGQGGAMDLEAGKGPFAKAAQEAEFFAKKQQYDIINGHATFTQGADGKMTLTGGEAFQDRQKQMAAENLLTGAGLDTPAMKIAAMQTNIANMDKTLEGILAAAAKDGIVLKDSD